jgi:signal transduction histidine kinase
LENIFNKYFQGNGDRKGWGIALVFVKEVVKAHGGEAIAESNAEAGTIFKLIFPKEGKSAYSTFLIA